MKTIKLTSEQKQEIVDLYNDDFYYDNIIDYFSYIDAKLVKQTLKKVLKDNNISWKEWKEIIKEANEFGVEGGDWYETIGLDTMYELLEMFDIDTDKTYYDNNEVSLCGITA